MLVWLPITGLAQTAAFEMVVEKTDGTELAFRITDDYPLLQYGGKEGINIIGIQTENGWTDVPCPEIKRLYTREVQIVPADIAVIPTAKEELIYTGNVQDLIIAGSSDTGTIQYSLDGETYSTDIPQGTDAKEYTVYYKVIGDEYHSDIAAVSFKVTISPKNVSSPTITLSETSYTYDGNAKEPTVTVKDGETTIPTTEYTVSYQDNIEVGTASVTITDKEGGNYTVSGSGEFEIIAPEEPDTPIVDKDETVMIGEETFYELTEEAKDATKETIQTDMALSSDATAVASVSDDGKIAFTQDTQDADIAILDAKKGEVLTVTFDGQMVGKKSQLKKLDSPAATRGTGDDELELVSGAGYEILEDGDIVLTLKLEEAPVEIESITLVTPETEPEFTETYDITIGKNGKTTFCGDIGLDFSYSDEVKAFIATGFDKESSTIWMTRVKDVPAGVPVMIKGTANETYHVPVTEGGSSYYKNMFVGNTTGESMSIGETSKDGKYVNYYMSGGQFKSVKTSANIGANKCYLQLPATFAAEATGDGYQVKIAASGKSSFAAPYDLDFTSLNDDVKAFTATGYDASTKTIWLTRVRKVQKGEGLLLKGTGGETYTIPSSGVQAAYENMIVGNIGDEITINGTSEDGTLTNYYLKGGTYMSVSGSANIGTNKSYLQLPTSMLAGATGARSEDALSSSDVLGDLGTQENLGYLGNLGIPSTCHLAELETESMPVVFQNTTGIKDNNRETITNNRDGQWFTLGGQRIDKPTRKGLYIHNGRKVVIR